MTLATRGGVAPALASSGVNWVTIPKFAELSGYTEDAIRSKIKRGDWLMDRVWKRAPDGRILISLRGYEQWLEGPAFAPQESRVFSFLSLIGGFAIGRN